MQKFLASSWVMLIVVIGYAAAAVSAFGIINTMVSLKYETDGEPACISQFTGRDLCADLRMCKLLAIGLSVGATCLLVLHIWMTERKRRADR